MNKIEHLENELRGRDRAIDMHLEEIESLRRDNQSLRHKIERYEEALEEIAYESPSERARRALEGDE